LSYAWHVGLTDAKTYIEPQVKTGRGIHVEFLWQRAVYTRCDVLHKHWNIITTDTYETINPLTITAAIWAQL